ncbi:unnamed protein product [Cylindrotheca closterium]|uniref:EF-hand domain-containing protein n=1 Tax=Cylindrotheca closterium TaxID=2856 RepID=A0AAD2JG67_9STRA|nr:unnamed protein product [Cylindrotheca closterium]
MASSLTEEELPITTTRRMDKRTARRIKRKKTYVKYAIKAGLLVAVSLGFLIYYAATSPSSSTTAIEEASASSFNTLNTSPIAYVESPILLHRRLQEVGEIVDVECGQLEKADPEWFAAIYFLGVLYTFIAIAIVCDELFVPALEEIASEDHMNLSMDVAGATLMAAGGSAPELFTSIFGTFVQESEVGIGTVVGSAVFNVLFVIAMCALLTKETLNLTWWPLFRDSFCYSVGLIMLGLFVGVISPAKIELWEAIVLFCLYICYVIIMYFNKRIYGILTGNRGVPAPGSEEAIHAAEENGETAMVESAENGIATAQENHTNNGEEKHDPAEEGSGFLNKHSDNQSHSDSSQLIVGDDGTKHAMHSNRSHKSHHSTGSTPSRRSMRRGPSLHSLDSGSVDLLAVIHQAGDGGSMKSIHEDESLTDLTPWPGTFRSGVLKILRNPESWKDTAGIGLVAVMAGDVHHVFKQVDVDDSGHIDKEELAQLFAKLECKIPAEELDMVMEELDENKDGQIDEEDFVKWYVHSEKRISMRTKLVFDFFDTDNSGKITRPNLKKLLKTVEPTVTDEDVDQAMAAMYMTGSKDEISFEEFSNWYVHSMIYQKRTKRIEEDEGILMDSIYPPEIEDGSSCGTIIMTYIKYIVVLPIVVILAFTVPDVRKPGSAKYCYISFLLSIGWIGVFSYYMVDWAEVIGHTIGIPSVIMGLTLLAAGTSVPDLLTSVIVARMGEGDMALSSSIGSNIFDILVGLPIPWIAYTALYEPITIGSKNVWVYIFTLLGMLVFVVVTTHLQGWKLTKTLAFLMLMFYFGFLALAILLELPFPCA